MIRRKTNMFHSARDASLELMSPFRSLLMGLLIVCLSASFASAGEWQTLFDGSSLEGWKPSQDNQHFALVDSVIVGSSSGQTRFLYTEQEFGDFELELEVKLHDTDLNSGVQIRTSTSRPNGKGDPRFVIHGPQVDLGKSPGRSGHIFSQGNGRWITPKAELTRNSFMKNGEWNQLRVIAQGPRIQTWINGERVSDFVDEEAYQSYPKGVIALQVHGVKHSPETARHISFRSIRIRELQD
uniref:3-keto-alpha-glucoside-1,2-lyase/3-keto-2-hydroxy-glucal hydratase domain-containing protein n=2 Tax=Rubinisphaera brasiliensis TaxID=119 RepID=F0SGG8_RUBBR|nr:protein of unknown function DUF1080 [Rubinisphaera brasiliensis DSM 5305]